MNQFVMESKTNAFDSDDDDTYIKELNNVQTVTISRKQGFSANQNPKFILSNNKQYIEQIFFLLTQQDASYIQKVWDMLMMLPTNSEIQKTLLDLEIDQENPNETWNRILDPKSIYKLLYSLQILTRLMNKELNAQFSVQWNQNFVKQGGISHLFNSFLNMKGENIKGSLEMRCVSIILKILFEFMNEEE